jgi:hypothetical protein
MWSSETQKLRDYRPGVGGAGKPDTRLHTPAQMCSARARASGSIRLMDGIIGSAQAAFTLLVVLFVGWGLVFAAAYYMERKLQRGKSGQQAWNSFTWLWDNANLIGIPTLVLGAVYMVWALNYGPGIGGPSALVLLLMGAAAALIGFAPSMRRLRRP